MGRIFLSYCSLDNHPSRELGQIRREGWITQFLANLRPHLNARLGTRTDYFIDAEKLRAGCHLTDEIMDALEEAEVFLAVVSPCFWKSSWCPLELGYFLEESEQPRVVKVVKLPPSLDPRKRVSDDGNLLEARFFYEMQKGATWLEADQREYHDCITALAIDLESYLEAERIEPCPKKLLHLEGSGESFRDLRRLKFNLSDAFEVLSELPMSGTTFTSAIMLKPPLLDAEVEYFTTLLRKLNEREIDTLVWMGDRPWTDADARNYSELTTQLKQTNPVINTRFEFESRLRSLEITVVSQQVEKRPGVYVQLDEADLTTTDCAAAMLIDWLIEQLGENQVTTNLDIDSQVSPVHFGFHLLVFDHATKDRIDSLLSALPETDVSPLVYVVGYTSWKRTFKTEFATVLKYKPSNFPDTALQQWVRLVKEAK